MAKTLTGIVSSDKANKTITITVTSRETHPIYGKQYSVTRKYIAHDENNVAKPGDKVVIVETRPISKRKSFTLQAVIEKSRGSVELIDEQVVAQKSDKKTAEADTPKLSAKKVSGAK